MNKVPLTTRISLKQREIPREVNPPSLSVKDIEIITKTCFIKPNPEKADLIFILGSSGGPWQKVAELHKNGLDSKILISGLLGEDYYPKKQPMAHIIRDALIKYGVPKNVILVQDKSTNTLEDVKFGKRVLEKNNIFPKKILFVCKSHHSGRALRTLKKYFPRTQLFAFTYDAEYRSTKVSQGNWWQKPIAKARVYGEYLRIKNYSKRGDII